MNNNNQTTTQPLYWCHHCRKEIRPTPTLTCPTCNSEFLEELKDEEGSPDDSPQNFFIAGEQNNQPQPQPQPIPQFSQAFPILQNLFQYPFVPIHGQANQAPHANLNNVLAQLLGFVDNMNEVPFVELGDYAFGQNLEEILQRTFLYDKKGNPPASKEVVRNLKKFNIEAKHAADTSLECSVCKTNYTEGEEATLLPCDHHFHTPCIMQWLEMHNTCPICRFELPTDDPDYEKSKELRRNRTNATNGSSTTSNGTVNNNRSNTTTTTNPNTTTTNPNTTTTINNNRNNNI